MNTGNMMEGGGNMNVSNPMGANNPMAGSATPGGMQGGVMTANAQNINQLGNKQAYHQIMKTLNSHSSRSPYQQRQILSKALKSYPQLKFPFMMQRLQSQNQNSNAASSGNAQPGGNLPMMNQQQQQRQQRPQSMPGQMGPRMQQMVPGMMNQVGPVITANVGNPQMQNQMANNQNAQFVVEWPICLGTNDEPFCHGQYCTHVMHLKCLTSKLCPICRAEIGRKSVVYLPLKQVNASTPRNQ